MAFNQVTQDPRDGNADFSTLNNLAQQIDTLSVNRLQLVGTETGTEEFVSGCLQNPFPSSDVSQQPDGYKTNMTWNCQPNSTPSTFSVDSSTTVAIFQESESLTLDSPLSVLKFPYDVLLEQMDVRWVSNSTNDIRFSVPSGSLKFTIDIGKIDKGKATTLENWRSLTRPDDVPVVLGQGLLNLSSSGVGSTDLGYPDLTAAGPGVIGAEPALSAASTFSRSLLVLPRYNTPTKSWPIYIRNGDSLAVISSIVGTGNVSTSAGAPIDGGQFELVFTIKRAGPSISSDYYSGGVRYGRPTRP